MLIIKIIFIPDINVNTTYINNFYLKKNKK